MKINIYVSSKKVGFQFSREYPVNMQDTQKTDEVASLSFQMSRNTDLQVHRRRLTLDSKVDLEVDVRAVSYEKYIHILEQIGWV